MRRILTLLAMLCVVSLQAQEAVITLTGGASQQQQDDKQTKGERKLTLSLSAYDSFTKVPLAAHVTLMRADSTVVDTVSCSVWDGMNRSYALFEVPRRQQTFILHATLEGYDDLWTTYELPKIRRNEWFEVPRLLMKRSGDIYKEVDLDGVVVTGTKVKIQYRGDTIVYNAAAFNLPEGSMLDGLVRQLPGAELKQNGDIYINGQRIDYLLLNGKDFFRGKNQLVLDNLPYYTVKDLKVYHKSTRLSERVGRDVEKKDYVMDVNLKREFNRNILANAEAGLGTEDRYLGRLFGMYFDDHTMLSAFGNLNNVNENRKPGSKGDWDPDDLPEGLLSTKMAGLHFKTEHPDKKHFAIVDATAQWRDADNRQETTTEHFASAGNILENSSTANRQKDFSLNVSNTLELEKPYNLSSLINLDYTRGRSFDDESSTAPLHTMRNRELGKSETIALNAHLRWHKPLPWGDFISLGLNGTWNHQRPLETFGQRLVDYHQTSSPDFRHSFYDNHQQQYDWTARFSYNLSLGNGFDIFAELKYNQAFTSLTNGFFRLDWLGSHWAEPDYSQTAGQLLRSMKGRQWSLPSTRDSLMLAYDLDNSDRSTTLTRKYTAELSFIWQRDNSLASFSLPVNKTDERINYMCDEDIFDRRSDVFVTPTISYFSWSRNYLMASYSLEPERPAFLDILPVDDTTNPMARVVNNPELKNRWTHAFELHKTWSNDSTEQTISVAASLNIIQDDWGTRTTYNPTTGAYTYMSDNVNGNWTASLGFRFERPIDRKKFLRLSTKTNFGYVHSVDFDIFFSDDEEANSAVRSKVNNLTLEEGLGLTYQRGTLTLGIDGNIAWRRTTSGRQGFENISAVDFDYGLTAQYELPWKLQIATDLKMFSRRGYQSHLMNDDHLVWNAQLTRSFLKEKLTLKLQAFDLLHELSNTQYEVNAQGRTETWHNSLPRYLMLTAAVKLSKSPRQQNKE